MASRDDPSGFPTHPSAPAVIPAPPGELEIGWVVSDRYEIRSRLGAGGMGAVWRAYDREMQEEIALKVLSAAAVDGAGMIDRLRREARIARKIAHPNVCKVFDYGEADGTHFITMELIEGRTLRALLGAGRVDTDQALAIVEQLAAGLGAVHAHGVVHRDVKPENVMVRPDGQAVLMDFGLARSPFADHTSTAGAAGTPAYMSPEQLRGEPLDPRSDIFSLGMVAFELLSGRPAFDGPTTAARVSSILRDPPPRLGAPEIPANMAPLLDEALARAMARAPEERFRSAGAFAAALLAARQRASARTGSPRDERRTGPGASTLRRLALRLAGASLLLAAAGLSILGWQRLGAPASTGADTGPPAPPSASAPLDDGGRVGIMVAPFDNVTREPEWDALADSAAESIRTGLRTMPPIALRDPPEPHPGAAQAKALGATWVVTGTVQRVGKTLRLAAQFHRTMDQEAEEPIEVDGDPEAPEVLLDTLRRRAVDEARLLHRDHERRRRAARGTSAAAARDSLLQYYAIIGPAPRQEHFDKGMRLLTDAIAADPAYVPALVERAYLQALGAGAPTREARLVAALADVSRALAADGKDAPAAVMRCRLLQLRVEAAGDPTDESIEDAMKACGDALIADPSSAHVYVVFSRLYDRKCSDAQAMDSDLRAHELDPSLAGRSLKHFVELALQNGQLEIAERRSQELVDLEREERQLGARSLSRRAGVPPISGAHLLRGAILMRLGRLEDARAELEQQLADTPTSSGHPPLEAAALRGLLRLPAGLTASRSREWHRRLDEIERALTAAVQEDAGAAQRVADALQWTDPDAAVTWLERAGRAAGGARCDESLRRALFYLGAGRREEARRALRECAPRYEWEKSCLAWVQGRL